MEARRRRDLLCKEQARKCLLFFKKFICGGSFGVPAPGGPWIQKQVQMHGGKGTTAGLQWCHQSGAPRPDRVIPVLSRNSWRSSGLHLVLLPNWPGLHRRGFPFRPPGSTPHLATDCIPRRRLLREPPWLACAIYTASQVCPASLLL